MMTKTKKRAKPLEFVIESRGGVLYNEFTDVEPAEFKVKSRREREKEQNEAWSEFDKELAALIRKRELRADPETGEVKKDDKD